VKRILVTTDGSNGAERAIGFAAGLAGKLGCELLVLNVIGGFDLPGGVLRELRGTQSAWFEDLLATNSAEILERAHDQVSALGVKGSILETRRGDVVSTVIEYVQEKQVDAIVVGKRGEGQLKALLLGSISQKLVSLAPIVVMVVP
jgi:nucleotide-binding universal stress UspA family protein